MRKNIIIAIVLVFTVGISYWLLANSISKNSSRSLEKTSISLSVTSLLPALVHIADNNNYFLEEGLEVEITDFSAGKFAFQAMLDGEADIATISDPNVVSQSFERDDFRIFSTIVDSANHAKALARSDAGIYSPDDLIGKKIATTNGTTASYFLVSFFIFHGLDIDSVEIVNLKPGEMVEALANGEVDAIFTWEPNILKAQEKLGGNGVLLPSEVGYSATFNLAAKDSFVSDNPKLLEKLVRALLKAEQYMEENREKSIEILSLSTGTNEQHVAALIDNYRFRLSLSQSLISSLEDQARWEISYNGSLAGQSTPNYLDYFVPDILKSVKPAAVTFID